MGNAAGQKKAISVKMLKYLSRLVRQHLNTLFENKWIGRGGAFQVTSTKISVTGQKQPQFDLDLAG